MSSTDASTDTSTEVSEVGTIDMKLEVVTLPVSDVDRAKSFYQSLGWRLDADFAAGDDFRVVQFTPPRSQCSIHFGKGITTAEPGSAAAFGTRGRGHRRRPGRSHQPRRGRQRGVRAAAPGPRVGTRALVFALASFSDPDGNGWLLQEVTTRLPGREWED